MQSDTQQFLNILSEEKLQEIIGFSLLNSKRQWKSFRKWLVDNGYGDESVDQYKNMEEFNRTASSALRSDILGLWHTWAKETNRDKSPNPVSTTRKSGILSKLLNF